MEQENKFCRFCGEEIKNSAIKCKHCGQWLDKNGETENNMPVEIKKFNWGAGLLAFYWSIPTLISAKTNNPGLLTASIIYFVIITFIPENSAIYLPVASVLALIYFIWFGIKGNEWAWKLCEWESVEQFNNVQRKWAAFGGIFIGLLFVSGLFEGIVEGVKEVLNSY